MQCDDFLKDVTSSNEASKDIGINATVLQRWTWKREKKRRRRSLVPKSVPRNRVRSRMRFGWIFTLSCLLLPGCSKYYEWHQKLTLIVNTPGGQLAASSVFKVIFEDSDSALIVPEARGARSKLYGEAIALEVAPDRYLFLLLDRTEHLAKNQFAFGYDSRNISGWVENVRAQQGKAVTVVDWSPSLATFEDINDPATVQKIDPDNLEAQFGAGFSIASIEFEITADPVTDGELVKTLWWLPEYYGKRFNPDEVSHALAENRVANVYSRYNFLRTEQ